LCRSSEIDIFEGIGRGEGTEKVVEMEFRLVRFALLVALVFGVARAAAAEAAEAQERQQDVVAALIKAYPDFLDRIGVTKAWRPR
jgi:hypothetical protein